MKDLLKILVAALTSILLTGAASWMVFGQDKVTRPELMEHVKTRSPWIMERGETTAAIKSNAESVGKLEKAVGRMLMAQQELIIEQRVLVTKVDALLDKDD